MRLEGSASMDYSAMQFDKGIDGATYSGVGHNCRIYRYGYVGGGYYTYYHMGFHALFFCP